MKMKAAVWTDYNKLSVTEVPRPQPGPGQVLIKVMAAGLCVTDLHVYTGRLGYGRPPHILGHEAAGEVCQTGPGTDKALMGRRVVVETSVGCGHCAFCATGRRHLCPHMEEIGTAPHAGGYAQYLVCPAENAVPLPDAVSWDEAAILESAVCPMGTLMRNGVRLGETVAVFGVGPAGLTFIQGARAMGAGRVIAIARNAGRLARAGDFGASVLIDSSREDVAARVLEETGGMGAGLVCEAAGAPQTIAQSFEVAGKAGRIYLYGIPGDDEAVPFPVMEANMKQLEIYGAAGEPQVWLPLLALVADGRINLRDMVTHTLPLDSIARGFALMESRNENPIKIVVHPWD